MLARITRIFVVIAWVSCLAALGHATTFVLMDEQQMLQTSVVVVVGTVTAIESAAPEPGGPIYTYVHIQPERIIKGSIEQKEIVLREPGGTLSDRREWTFGAPEFWVGERC